MTDEVELSFEARAVAGIWFGMMPVGRESHLRFGMIESRPTAKAQAALNELVAAGVISRENDKRGPVTYRPLKSCWEFLKSMMKAQIEGGDTDPRLRFPLTEKIEPAADPVRGRMARR